MVMQCKQCNAEIEYTDLEKKIRETVGVSAPELCYRCRMKRRFSMLSKYGFVKVTDTIDGQEIITASPYVGKRKITSLENYQNKILDELNK